MYGGVDGEVPSTKIPSVLSCKSVHKPQEGQPVAMITTTHSCFRLVLLGGVCSVYVCLFLSEELHRLCSTLSTSVMADVC